MSSYQHNHGSSPFQPQSFPIRLICDGIDGPANAGGLLRLCDAFGVQEVIFGPSALNLDSDRLRKTSRSAHQWVAHRFVEDLHEEIAELKTRGTIIIGLEITSSSIPVENVEIDPSKEIALVIGSERNGISDNILRLLDHTVHIEMYGRNSSMNVVQASAIALYQLTKIIRIHDQ